MAFSKARPPLAQKGAVHRVASPRRHVENRVKPQKDADQVTTNSTSASIEAILQGATLVTRDPTSEIRAIQSRVDELVRNYDDFASPRRGYPEDFSEDEEDVVVPTRWRVGDLLKATHSSLAKTSTNVERSIATEIEMDDEEISSLLDGGTHNIDSIVSDLSGRSEHLHDILSKSLYMVHNLQQATTVVPEEQAETTVVDNDENKSSRIRIRELNRAIHKLQMEKEMLLKQLEDQAKAYQRVLSELSNAEQGVQQAKIELSLKTDEIKNTRETYDKRIGELKLNMDLEQHAVVLWRDKYRASEQEGEVSKKRIVELEATVRAQGEDILKHEFLLNAKVQELEHQRAKIQQLEAENSSMEATIAAQRTESQVVQAPPKKLSQPVRASKPTSQSDPSEQHQHLQEALDRIEGLESILKDAAEAKRRAEENAYRMASQVEDLKAAMRDYKAEMSNEPRSSSPPRHASPMFVLQRPKKRSESDKVERARYMDDDLSTSDSDNEDEHEDEDKKLGEAVQKVMSSVFPASTSTNVEGIDQKLAELEEATSSEATESSFLPKLGQVTAEDVEKMRIDYHEKLQNTKDQFVRKLTEYKHLLLQQYELKQDETRRQHRTEMESLVTLIQNKYKNDMNRRNEEILKTKETLKRVYRVLAEREKQNEEQSPTERKQNKAEAPLKSLLRSAVLAMSGSKKRNKAAASSAAQAYEEMGRSLVTIPSKQPPVSTPHLLLESESKEAQTDVVPVDVNVTAEAPSYQTVDVELAIQEPSAGLPSMSSVLCLNTGICLAPDLIADLQTLLPALSLPANSFCLSASLRKILWRDILTYYATESFDEEPSPPKRSIDSPRLVESPRPPSEAERAYSPLAIGFYDDEERDAQTVFCGSPRASPSIKRMSMAAFNRNKRNQELLARTVFATNALNIMSKSKTFAPARERLPNS